MSEENIKQVTEINPNGKYIIQFPEGTSEEVRNQMDTLLETARKEGKNVYLEPGVKVFDVASVAKAEVVAPPVAPQVQAPVAVAPEPSVSSQPVPEPQPQNSMPVQQPVQLPPGYVHPDHIIMNQPVAVGQQQYQYNPFGYQAPMPVQQAPQPVYYPGVAPQYGWVQTPQGFVPVQPVRQYNPQLAEGPIGMHEPRTQQVIPQKPVGGNANTLHPPYTNQPQQ